MSLKTERSPNSSFTSILWVGIDLSATPSLSVEVIDQGSLLANDLIASLMVNLIESPRSHQILMAPAWALHSLDKELEDMNLGAALARTRKEQGSSSIYSVMDEMGYVLSTQSMWSWSLHVDTDHLGETLELWKGGKGFSDSIALETRKVSLASRECTSRNDG